MFFKHRISIEYPIGWLKWSDLCLWLTDLGRDNYHRSFHTSKNGVIYRDFYFIDKETAAEFKLRFG